MADPMSNLTMLKRALPDVPWILRALKILDIQYHAEYINIYFLNIKIVLLEGCRWYWVYKGAKK